MNVWLKLLIPLGLGVAAGVLNWMAMTSEVARYRYVRLESDLPAGRPFTAENLDSIESDGDWRSTAVPWERRAILYGRAAPRSLGKGDLVFWRDIRSENMIELAPGETALNLALDGVAFEPALLEIGGQVGFVVPGDDLAPLEEGAPPGPFDVLGPFRVVSVGRRTTQSTRGDLQHGSSVVSVAIRPGPGGTSLDARTSRLLWANRNGRIGAITFYPRESPGEKAPALPVVAGPHGPPAPTPARPFPSTP